MFFFCFPFITNINNAIVSNQSAQIQRKIYEMYRAQTCSPCEISVKKQWSSQGCVERHLYSCYSVIPTHVHLSLNSPPKHILLPRFPLPRFQRPRLSLLLRWQISLRINSFFITALGYAIVSETHASVTTIEFLQSLSIACYA